MLPATVPSLTTVSSASLPVMTVLPALDSVWPPPIVTVPPLTPTVSNRKLPE